MVVSSSNQISCELKCDERWNLAMTKGGELARNFSQTRKNEGVINLKVKIFTPAETNFDEMQGMVFSAFEGRILFGMLL